MSQEPRLGYDWHLRMRMAQAGMFATTELVPLLAERGIHLSAAQVYRLVAQNPERLSLRTLVALCDILDCTPNDLIEPVAVPKPARRAATGGKPADGPAPAVTRTPRRAEIVKPQ